MRIIRFLVVLSTILIIAAAAVAAQSDITPENNENLIQPLPAGYGLIELGMHIETVKRMLAEEPNFAYRGDADVSMRPSGDQQVIDCEGVGFVDRAYFQFDEDILYLITMVLDREYIDHYSIYTALTGKYGEPESLNPSRIIWQDEKITVSLERPLSIKYIDREVFQRLQEQGSAESSMETMLRQDFINSF